jgi:hypothetical protein
MDVESASLKLVYNTISLKLRSMSKAESRPIDPGLHSGSWEEWEATYSPYKT